MAKTAFEIDEVLRFFEDYNLGPWKLGRLLDIPGDKVKRYLLNGSEIDQISATKIDTAICVIGNQWTARPEWNVGNMKKKNGRDLWNEKIGIWNQKINDAIKEQEKEQRKATEDACMMILMILSDSDDPGEFTKCYDPIANRAGLDNYGTDEFVRRIRERVRAFEEL